MTEAIAVFDIGMTNKKVLLYSLEMELLEEHKRIFPPLLVDGIETHDLTSMETWFLSVLKECSSRVHIRAIAVSTHGATFVCTDKRGNPVAPCIYYTHEPGPDFHNRFYAKAGERIELQR
ncbi:MAG: carbohydrate kinase, partial [Rectinema sp.]|nr:carbohydrate kinase [Rectinema sp.]